VATSADSNDDFDPSVLDELRRLADGRKELFTALLAAFEDETPALLLAMRSGVAEADAAKLRTAAHTLKGTAVNLGALRLAQLCAELETRARASRMDGAESLLAKLEPHVRRLAEMLQAECQRLA
jgi:HPt (histidine-containing phosphotransfer) domain-containing protein